MERREFYSASPRTFLSPLEDFLHMYQIIKPSEEWFLNVWYVKSL